MQHRANGGESRAVFSGELATGEQVAVHESSQPASATPNEAHSISHTELLCLCQGTLEFTHDGRTERVEAGDVVLIAYGTHHGFRNIGTGTANYFVVALGGDTNH